MARSQDEVKAEKKDFFQAVVAMASVIPFFPQDHTAQLMIATCIEQFVETKKQLDWLTMQAISHIRDWSKAGGVPELRGIFCTGYKPADGQETYASTPGFTASDLEQQYIQREMERSEQRLLSYQEEARAKRHELENFPLPDVKKLQ